jgi:hypothetical protein
MRDFVERVEPVSKPPSAPPAADSETQQAPEATPADEPEEEESEDAEIPQGQPGDLSTRPQQMAVAALIILGMLYLLYLTIKRG